MSEMGEPHTFFVYVIDILEEIGTSYMVVGGYAATVYGEPRLTLDDDSTAKME